MYGGSCSREKKHIQKSAIRDDKCRYLRQDWFEPESYLTPNQDVRDTHSHIRSGRCTSDIDKQAHNNILPQTFAKADAAFNEQSVGCLLIPVVWINTHRDQNSQAPLNAFAAICNEKSILNVLMWQQHSTKSK